MVDVRNNPKVETAQTFIVRRMDQQQNALKDICIEWNIIQSSKGNCDAYYKIDETGRYYVMK